MSNVLEKLIDTFTVLCGSLCWLKLKATLCVEWRKTIGVQCCLQKTCSVSERGKELSSGRRSLYNTLTEAHMRDMDRELDPFEEGLPRLRRETIDAIFHISAISAVF